MRFGSSSLIPQVDASRKTTRQQTTTDSQTVNNFCLIFTVERIVYSGGKHHFYKSLFDDLEDELLPI